MPVLFLLVGMGVLLWMVQSVYKKNWYKNLKVEIRFQDKPAIEGGEACMTEIIRNEKRLPIPLLHVKFQTDKGCDFHQEENASTSDYTYKNDIFSLMGYSQVKRTIIFNCRRRGRYIINQTDLVTGFLFFENFSYAKQAQDTSLIVYPALVELEGLDEIASQMVWSAQSRARLMSDPFAYVGIREYTPADPMKTINWKASAHTGSLMVNVYDKNAGLPVEILVNLQRPLSRLADDIVEESIRIAVTWAERLMQNGLFVSLRTNADTERPNEDKKESWDELNTRMAMLDTRNVRSFSEWIDEEVLPYIRPDVCYGIVSFDTFSDMREATEAVANAAGEIWLIRPALHESERAYHSGRVHILERWVEPYGK